MSKSKFKYTSIIIVIAIVAIGGGIFAGLGGVDGVKDFLGVSENNGLSTPLLNKKTPAKKRSRAVAGKPYAELLKDGNALVGQGDLDGALEMFQEAARISPKDPIPYEKVGDVFVLQGNYEKASESFRFAFSLNSNNRILFLKRVRSLINGRNISEAQTQLAKVQTKTPEIIYLESLVSSFYNEQQKARDGFSEILKIKLEDANQTDLTSLVVLQNYSQKMTTMYENFELANDAPLSYLQALLAKSYNEIGEYGLSIEIAFNALKIQNDYRDVWITLGHSFLRTQRWFDAEDALTKAIALDQTHPASYFYRGLARMKLQKVRDALSDFSLAGNYGYKPQVQINLQMANAHFVLGNNAQSLELYQNVLFTDPAVLSYFKRPVELSLFGLNDLAMANQLIDLALKNHPKHALPYAWKAFITIKEGNLLEARALISQSQALDKQEPMGELAQAELDRARGNQDVAEASYKSLLEKLTSEDDVLIKQYIESVTSSFSLPSLTLD